MGKKAMYKRLWYNTYRNEVNDSIDFKILEETARIKDRCILIRVIVPSLRRMISLEGYNLLSVIFNLKTFGT